MKIKKFTIILATIIAAIILLSQVYAFAVSSAYTKENPLTLTLGETKDIKITLQNMAGNENITAKAEITEGTEIAQITDESNIYFIPLGSRKEVNIRVSLPDNTKINNYSVKISVTTVAAGEAGTFGFGSSIDQNIPILVTKTAETQPTTKTGTSWLIYLIIGIVILIILIIVLKRKR